jgi:hypothetical protein
MGDLYIHWDTTINFETGVLEGMVLFGIAYVSIQFDLMKDEMKEMLVHRENDIGWRKWNKFNDQLEEIRQNFIIDIEDGITI